MEEFGHFIIYLVLFANLETRSGLLAFRQKSICSSQQRKLNGAHTKHW